MEAQKHHLKTEKQAQIARDRLRIEATGPETTQVRKPTFWPISTVYMSLGVYEIQNLKGHPCSGKYIFLIPESKIQVQSLKEERKHDVGPAGELPARQLWHHLG